MQKGKNINKEWNVNTFPVYQWIILHMLWDTFPHCNLETAGTDEVLFDKYTMVTYFIYAI